MVSASLLSSSLRSCAKRSGIGSSRSPLYRPRKLRAQTGKIGVLHVLRAVAVQLGLLRAGGVIFVFVIRFWADFRPFCRSHPFPLAVCISPQSAKHESRRNAIIFTLADAPCLTIKGIRDHSLKKKESPFMPISQEIAPHLPHLRRFSRALSGSQASGDAYVVATLEALVVDPDPFHRICRPRSGFTTSSCRPGRRSG